MDVSKRDEAIAVVVSLTGAEEELALFLLEENNWNIDMCVRSYLNNEIADEEKPICRENPKRKIRSPIRNTSGIISENPFATEDRKTSLLMREKEPFGNYKEDLKMLPGRRFSRKKRTRSCFGMDTEDDLISSSNQVDELKRKRLSDLFRLPLDLNFCGNFDSVKHHCRISQKWLLVNIQSAIEFSCLQLNRDTWSDSSVRSVLCEHFILWQRYFDSEEGRQYCYLYPKAREAMPHISVIDPNTGEMLIYWNHYLQPNILLSKLTTFLEDHFLPDQLSLIENSVSSHCKKEKSILDCSEEEQLAAAISESLASQNSTKKVYYENEIEELEVGEETDKALEEGNDLCEQVNKQTVVIDDTGNTSGKAVTGISEEDSCMIQIREVDGTMIHRQFSLKDTLRKVYEFVLERRRQDSKQCSSLEEKKFSLMTAFPRRQVFCEEQLRTSLEQINLGRRFVLIVTEFPLTLSTAL